MERKNARLFAYVKKILYLCRLKIENNRALAAKKACKAKTDNYPNCKYTHPAY